MKSTESVPLPGNAQQVLASAIAHRIEHMSQEDLQALVNQADLALQSENAALRQRVRQLEEAVVQERIDSETKLAEYERALYKLTRDYVKEQDWDDFDPSEYTVSAPELLGVIDKLEADVELPG